MKQLNPQWWIQYQTRSAKLHPQILTRPDSRGKEVSTQNVLFHQPDFQTVQGRSLKFRLLFKLEFVYIWREYLWSYGTFYQSPCYHKARIHWIHLYWIHQFTLSYCKFELVYSDNKLCVLDVTLPLVDGFIHTDVYNNPHSHPLISFPSKYPSF